MVINPDSPEQSPENSGDDGHTNTTEAPVTTIGDMSSDSINVSANIEGLSGFDPAIHASNPDGTPKRRANGEYAKKRGRKAGTGNLPGIFSAPANKPENEQAETPQRPRVSSEQAAKMAANTVINLAVIVCGEEIGMPESQDEANGLKICFKDYFDAKGVPDIPPELGIVLGIAAYFGPRLLKEQTLTRLDKFKLQFAGFLSKIRGR